MEAAAELYSPLSDALLQAVVAELQASVMSRLVLPGGANMVGWRLATQDTASRTWVSNHRGMPGLAWPSAMSGG